jgi:hypothetical protein
MSGAHREDDSLDVSYAVIWQQECEDAAAGRLDFDQHALWLHGSNRSGDLRVELPFEEIVSADRAGRLGPYPAIRIVSKRHGTLLLAGLSGIGIVAEIFDVLRQVTV